MLAGLFLATSAGTGTRMAERDSDPIRGRRHTWARRLGRAIVWSRLLLIVAWIVGAAFATSRLPAGFGSEGAELGSLVPSSSRAVEVEEKALQTFGFPLISRSMVVARKEGGFGPAA